MPDGFATISMTPDRFHHILKLMRLSQRALARELKCSTRLTFHWGIGKITVPQKIAAWLEECAAILEANPIPEPPRDWRRRDPRYSLRRLKQRKRDKIVSSLEV